MANNPELLKMPLARDGQKSTIPETTDASTGLFSQQYGWQSINSLPPQAGGKAVKREDFNGAFNLLGGIAYYAQKGFTFKWSAEQDYYAGCVVIDDTDGLRYECVADVTANNTAPSADATHWQIFKAGTDIDVWFRQASTVYAVGDMRCYESLPYGWYLECTTAGTTGSSDITIPSPLDVGDTITDGTVVWTIRKIGSGDGSAVGDIKAIAYNGTVQPGWLLCDGRAVSRTMFPDLFDAIGTTYGAGDGSTTFNLPNADFIKASQSKVIGVYGNGKTLGLTDGNSNGGLTTANDTVPGKLALVFTNSAYGTSAGQGQGSAGTSARTSKSIGVVTDGDSGLQTTIPASEIDNNIRYIIKAFDGVTPTPAEADISEMLTELTGKADRRLSNLDTANLACHVVVDSYYDSTTGDWWREYDDGWIEQGGHITSGTLPTMGLYQITLLKAMADNNYFFAGNYGRVDNVGWIVKKSDSTTTVVNISQYNNGSNAIDFATYGLVWYVCGMGAQS